MAQEANDDTGSTISVSTASDIHDQVKRTYDETNSFPERFLSFTVATFETSCLLVCLVVWDYFFFHCLFKTGVFCYF